MSLRTFASAAALSIVLAAAGCSFPERGTAVPSANTTEAQPLGIANARFYADGDASPMVQEGQRAFERELTALRAEGRSTTRLPAANYLAMSGGGDNGAFGAGLMRGWTESGTRPEFKMVTGVSTGALIAPFAFLGPDYDVALREVYTTMTPDKVFRARGLMAALYDDAMADTGPLAQVIASYADQKMFDAIAREYAKGRLLLIGTTDLDAQRPVIWNVGALAASGHPQALDLFRKILRASAAIPGAFQPVMIDVEFNGTQYQEMHVDGGAIAQLFLYPPSIDLKAAAAKRVRRAYVVRNGPLKPNHSASDRRTVSIAGRAIETMLVSSGKNDVLRTYFVTQRDGVEYNLAYIGNDFSAPKKGEFDQAYMIALYEYGYRQALENREWHKLPPGLEAAATARAK